jgi:hypothetical protein
MAYTLKLFSADDVTETDRTSAVRRFRNALEASLGDEQLVLPVYRAYLRLLHIYGDHQRPWQLSEEEQLLADQWEVAELSAIQAAFGQDRYMGDAQFELSD